MTIQKLIKLIKQRAIDRDLDKNGTDYRQFIKSED